MGPVNSDHVRAAVADAHRAHWSRVLAATVRTVADLDLAEDCVQDAYAAALLSWERDGVPDRPVGWLIQTARNRAFDLFRREGRLRDKLSLLIEPVEGGEEWTEPGFAEAEDTVIPDDRLRLVFLTCHPALSSEAQMALTLRLVCGMTTVDIARTFLVSDSTMAARLTRAKHKIRAARIPMQLPAAQDLPERLQIVLGVIYALFSAGHTAPSGPNLMRLDLAEEAVRLGRLVRELMPREPEAAGLLGLLLATHARRATRVDAKGQLIRFPDQDRSQWDGKAILEAQALLDEALSPSTPGRFALEAAIALEYLRAPTYEDTAWPEILKLYNALLRVWPSPVVALNRAVVLSMVEGPEAALGEVERLQEDGRLLSYHYLSAVRADLLERLGRAEEAAGARRAAREHTRNDVERAALSEKSDPLTSGDRG